MTIAADPPTAPASAEPPPTIESDPGDPPPRDLTDAELDAVEAANRTQAGQRSTTNPPATPSTNGHHRPLPEARDAEEALLGACLLNPQAISDATEEGITARAFTLPAHQLIWDAIAHLYTRGEPTDVVSVADVLARHDHLERIGGPPRLIAFQDAPASIGAAPRYARIVLDHHHLRQGIVAAAEVMERLYQRPDDVPAALQQAQERLAALTTTDTTRTLEWEDVAGAMRGEVTRTIPDHLIRTDGQALIYPGRLHWLMGEPGKGKSWVALLAAHQLLEVDIGRVVYLDWENSRDLIADRLNTLGTDPERVQHQLRYTRSPSIDATAVATLAASITDGPNTLVIIDGAAPSIASGGWNEDKAADVLGWLRRLVWPLCATGAAVLVLDHVTKDRETRGLWPRGSGAKAGEVDGAAWLLRTRTPFSRQRAGHADLIQAKDREGTVGEDGTPVATLHVEPNPSSGTTTFELRPPSTSTTPDGTFRPTVLMERISRWLENENRYDRRPGRKQILDAVTGKKAALEQALQVLIDEGWVSVETTGRTHPHRVERVFREDEDQGGDGGGAHPDEEEF